MQEAPDGKDAYRQLLIGWYLRLDLREFMHPAVQEAIRDSYKDSKQTFEDTLLPLSFYRNYDEYHLLRWRSNILAREQMIRDYPQKELEESLPTMDALSSERQMLIEDILKYRDQLPVVIAKERILKVK